VAIETVSNRADLVSGGDVLVRVISPPGNARNDRVALFVNGERFKGELHAAPDGHGSLALVTGLNLGHNTLTLTAGGQEAGEDGEADEESSWTARYRRWRIRINRHAHSILGGPHIVLRGAQWPRET